MTIKKFDYVVIMERRRKGRSADISVREIVMK